MKRLATLVFAVACCLWAADFWQSKPFTGWSDKELQRMLSDSPWAKEVSVGLGPVRTTPNSTNGTRDIGDVRGSGNPPVGASSSPSLADPSTPPGELGSNRSGLGGIEPPDSSFRKISVIVRWQSALPVRQAVVRVRYGSEAATAPQAKKLLEQDAEEYVIAMSDVPTELLRGDLAKLQQSMKDQTTLSVKGKPALRPTQVEFGDPYAIRDVFFAFPRSTAFTLDDKEIEFSTRIGGSAVKYRFRLKDMVYNGKLEL